MATASDGVKISSPFGWAAEAHGQTVAVLLIAVMLAFLGYRHHVSSEEQMSRLFEAIAENTYLLSLSPTEREKLNIVMPESLRRKLRGP